MNKTIEAAFFKAFSFGGVLYECFEWLEHKYDLGLYFDREAEKKGRKQPSGKWKKYYDEILPQSIKEGTDAFDYTVIEHIDSPLIDEIANNLDECQNAMQRDRYIFSLLKPFKEYSDKFNPLSIEKQNKGEVKGVVGISELERDLAMWESLPPDEALKNVNGEPSGTPKEQVEACKKMIERCKYNIERANYVANRYREILSSDVSLQDGTVEYCMSHLHFYLIRFAYRLDALLLERGINLLWYQNECGIYLFEYRDITTIDFFIGSYQLARKYIDEALPKFPEPQPEHHTQHPDEPDLPSEPNKKGNTTRGRQSKPFASYVNGDTTERLEKLHSIMKDRRGKGAALVMKVAISEGLISKPTFRAVTNEFGDIGNESGYNKAMRENTFTNDEIQGVKNLLNR